MSAPRSIIACSTALMAVAAVFLAVAPASAQNLLVNGDFSAALDGWTTVAVAGGGFVGFPRFEVDPGVACLADRNGNPRLMINVPDEAEGYIVQALTLPAAPATLSLVSWNNLDATTVTVSIETLADGGVHDLESWSPPSVEAPGLTCSGAQPISKEWDVSAFAGQAIAVRLRARGGTGYNGTIADFDDVLLVAATTTSSTTTTTSTLPPGPCSGMTGGEAIACLCEADIPEPCSEVDVPERIAKRFEATCRTAGRGAAAGTTRKARRLLGKARRKIKGLMRAVTRIKADATCVEALIARGALVQSSIDEARAAAVAP